MGSLDEPIRDALLDFTDTALDGTWSGRREREAVSLFAFGPLLEQVGSNGTLKDTAQIGLEVAVPQVPVGDEDDLENKKNQVCKDLVIWPEPAMTCWDEDGQPTAVPLAVLEWKYDQSSVSEYDVNWLDAFTSEYPECTGYAITANPPGSRFTLTCTRVTADEILPRWVNVP